MFAATLFSATIVLAGGATLPVQETPPSSNVPFGGGGSLAEHPILWDDWGDPGVGGASSFTGCHVHAGNDGKPYWYVGYYWNGIEFHDWTKYRDEEAANKAAKAKCK